MSEPKKSILIVDDDPGIRESVRLAIEEANFLDAEITESVDAASGLEQFKKVKPDIIILDLHLPDKSGFEFMDILNKNKLLAGTKVIMLTVDDTIENVFKASNKGIDAYYFLGKPFNVSDLQALILSFYLPDRQKIN